MPWAFKNLEDGRGDNVIKAWLDTLPPKAKAKINARIRHLSVEEMWPRGWMEKIQGYEDVFELRVISFNVQYRPLGFFGPQRKQFTFVLGAKEVNNRIVPENAFATAAGRCRAVKEGRSTICDHSFK